MSLWSVKNGVKRRISGYVPATYPAENVTYGSTDVDSALDSIDDELSAVLNVYGSKNLADPDTGMRHYGTSWSANGLTFVANADGSISLSGQASAATLREIFFKIPFKAGKYIISGCPSGGGVDDTYALWFRDGDNTFSVVDIGNGAEVTVPTDVDIAYFGIAVYSQSGRTYNNLVFRPMIRDARISDPTYVPYAPTNRDLATVQPEINTMNNILGAKNFAIHTGKNSEAIDGITYTTNANKTIKANGTASANSEYVYTFTSNIPAGLYKLNGSVLGTKIYVQAFYDNNFITNLAHSDDGAEVDCTIDYTGYNNIRIIIHVPNGTSINNVIVSPMLRPAPITDSTYAPYAMTNRELTEEVKSLEPMNGKYMGFVVPTGGAYALAIFLGPAVLSKYNVTASGKINLVGISNKNVTGYTNWEETSVLVSNEDTTQANKGAIGIVTLSFTRK